MGQSGDASAQQPQMPGVPEGDEKPMIEEDVTPEATSVPAQADEASEVGEVGEVGEASQAVPDEAVPDDATTQIVSQQPTPPPAAPPRRSGAPPRASGAPAMPPYQAGGAGSWQGPPNVPNVVPVVAGQQPQMPGSTVHSPWHTASSWGATTFVITAETAAGFSYLFWWISGLLVYFNERENRFVRFHAVQSILLTGILSVFSVVAFTVAAILNDLFLSTHNHIWQTLCVGTVALSLLIVLVPWLLAMVAAWSGTYLQLPIVGDYAERFAAPPIQLRP